MDRVVTMRHDFHIRYFCPRIFKTSVDDRREKETGQCRKNMTKCKEPTFDTSAP